jgi:NADPH:quinone reductase-like Zn-dependent oxidoreductase
MRALVLTRHGAPDVLRIEDRPEPKASAGEVVIRVHAAGVNFADLQARLGLYPDAPKPPCVVGYEVAGIVDSVGPGGDTKLVGTRVMAPTRFGGYAELALAKARDLIPLPETMSYAEGAAIPVVAGTAYEAVVKQGSIEEGEICVIHGAAGGVGLAAVQIAKARGAKVVGTASPGKHAALREHGVDLPLDGQDPDLARKIRDFSKGHGVDVVLDSRAGAGFRESYALLRAGGRLVVYGASSVSTGNTRDLFAAAKMWVTTPSYGALPLMQESKSVCGVNLLKLWDDQGHLERVAKPITKLMADGVVKPVVGKTFALEEGPAAHQYIHDRKNIGKVVLVVRGD